MEGWLIGCERGTAAEIRVLCTVANRYGLGVLPMHEWSAIAFAVAPDRPAAPSR